MSSANVEQLITDHIDLWTSAIENKISSGRGSSKKQSLYGIKKLRELILELAVRGKLVPQDPSDAPASVLLERIAEERDRLVKEKKIKKPKKLPEISDEFKPFNIPQNWEWVRLGNVGYTQTGGTPPKSKPYLFGNDVPFIKPGDIEGGNVNFFNEGLSLEGQEHLSRTARVGSVLMVCIGTIGKCAAIDRDCCFNQQINAVTPYKDITPYLSRALSADFFQKSAWGESSSTTIAILNKGKWEQLVLPLPPLEEQQRIADKVDELMALCDQLEDQTENNIEAHQILVETLLGTLTQSQNADELAENWERVAEHFDTLFTTEHSIDQLKQTILQLAVMGKLVPQNPNDEPASSLLERIATEKEQLIKEKVIKKQKPLPPIDEDDKPFVLPQGWEWVNLQELITIMDAGWSPACPPEPSPNNETWGVLKTTAIQTLEYRENENKVLAATKDPRPKYEVKVGDILITRAGPKNRVGISCLVKATRPKLMISDKIIRFHLVELGMSERFISLCLNAGATAEYLEASKSGMAESQMNISQDKLKAAPIPLCPISEQRRVIDKVDQLMILTDQLKINIQQAGQTHLSLAEGITDQALKT